MLTPGGHFLLGTISTATTTFLSVFFLEKYLEERNGKKRFEYLVLSVSNMLSFLFVVNVV
ncbi:hypothetical protein SNUCP2_12620 [Clostridium perfringens A]